MSRVKVNGVQYDSKLEARVMETFSELERIPSRQKPSIFTVLVQMGYNPDGVYKGKHHTLYLEVKGRLMENNRKVLMNIPPEERKNLKFVLQSASQRYKPKGKSSICKWLDKYGYEWTSVEFKDWEKDVQVWLDEADNGYSNRKNVRVQPKMYNKFNF